MNRGRMFRRRALTNVESLQEAATESLDKVRDQAGILAEQAREGLARGGAALKTMERAMVRDVRDHPAFYLSALVALIGLFIAKHLVDRRY